MNSILALTDYKHKFGSKHFDTPYRSGMDKEKLTTYFNKHDFQIEFLCFNKIDLTKNYEGVPILYTSSEDIGYRYKSYIEDTIYSLELAGAHMIPHFQHLRANNNKVFMEQMRVVYRISDNIKSRVFGSLADLQMHMGTVEFPCVFKRSGGASGTGVALIKTKKELVAQVKAAATNRNYREDLRDLLRAKKHKGYIKESVYRDKFIIQEFIPNLTNDWKIYVFGEKVYIFKRPVLKGRGIKASGGGYDNYFYGLDAEAPEGILDIAVEVFEKLNIPHLSIDIAYDGKEFYVIEFQSLYFGTAGIPYSKGYFIKQEGVWNFIEEKLEIEQVYTDSIVTYLNRSL